MKNILQILFFTMIVGIASLSAQDTLLYEDFEAGVMPAGWSEDIGAATQGWEFSTTTPSPLGIPDHTTYASINDYECDCDMSSVYLKSPTFDLSTVALPKLIFETFCDVRFGGLFQVKISTDGGATYPTVIKDLTFEGGSWETVQVDLSAYTSQTNVSIAFFYNDEGIRVHSYSVDDVLISGSPQHEMAIESITPSFEIEGNAITPAVSLKNNGVSNESSWTLQLTGSDGYNETISDETTITSNTTYDVEFPQWNPIEGTYTLTATLTLTDDSDLSNNELNETVNIVRPFSNNALAGNGNKANYYNINLTNGDINYLSTFPSTVPYVTSEEFAGDYKLYRINTDQQLFTVNPSTGTTTLVTTLSIPGNSFSSLAYDWENNIMYIMTATTSPSQTTLGMLDLNTYAITNIGTVHNSAGIVGMDMASDGFLYATFSDELIKINPSNASYTVIGHVGHDINSSYLDLSYDRENDLLLTIDRTTEGSFYGYYNLSTGKFVKIKEMADSWNFTSLAHYYIPYSATFTVSDANGLLENAEVNINGKTITTNSSGEATLDLINGTYNYTVSKAGYDDFTGSVTVNDNNVTITITLSETEYPVTFNVSDDSGPLIGASVDINSQSLTTNSSGVATIELTNGDYPYTISLTGYDDATGSINVSNAPASEDVTMVETTYSATFTVTDGTNPLSGATVSVNSTDKITNSSGIATFSLVNGDYPYTVSLTDYDNASGTININNTDVNESVTLNEATYSVTFAVTDGADPLEGATININGSEITTSTEGLANIFLVPGDYPYLVTLNGYDDASGSVSVVSSDVTELVSMIETTYTVTFNVTDGSDPLEGALVEIPSESLSATTDASGVATFMLPADVFDYEISLNLYNTQTGSITVPVGGTTVNETLTLTPYDVTFTVTDGANPLEGANIHINDTDYLTNASGIAIAADLPPADYDYTVSLTGYDTETGVVTVETSDVAVPVTLAETTYTVTFNVTDGTNPLEGATVTIDGGTITTGSDGLATIELVPNDYSYTVDLAAYDQASGNITVADQPVTENVEMVETTYLVTLNVTDGATALEGATINIDGTTITTDPDGLATIDLVPNDYPYTVDLDGYNQTSGNISVVDQPVTENVEMIETTYTVTFNVTDGSDPLAGALIEIPSESLSATTDASGVATFMLPADVFDYEISLNLYNTQTGSITIPVGGTTVNETLTLTPYDVTFTVTDGANPLEGANIHINDTDYLTNASGIAIAADLPPADYDYTVSLTGYDTETGVVTVETSDVAVPVTLAETTYTVTFNVTDGTNPLEGATVTIDGGTITTGSDGLATIELVPNDYSYTVDLAAYDQASGNITVADQPVTENVEMVETTYLVTLNVTDGATALEGATINIDGTTITTDPDGLATIDLVPNDYPYTVDQDGYEQATGNITVVDQSVTEEVTLTETTYLVTFNVTDGTNPLEGATINIEGIYGGTIISDSDGIATIELLPGEYNYTAAHANFSSDVNGTVIVTNAPVTENVEIGVGIDDNQTASINIYPNPTKGEIHIDCQGKANIIIMSANGKVVKTTTINNEGIIDLEDLSEGSYFIRIESGKGVQTKQIILRK